MHTLKFAIRKLFAKGEHCLTRIISLSAGLGFGTLLLSEVFYYYSYDSFYPDAERIYIVNENYNPDKSAMDKLETHPRVSGAIGPELKAEVPGIESATRLNSIGRLVFYSKDNRNYKADFVLADEHLFEVLPRPMLEGKPEEILKTPMTCIVSSEIAAKIGGNVVGETIEIKNYPGKMIRIGGIFEKIPENTNYSFDIAISMVSTSKFTWDGTKNWIGNDRYYTCVKLQKGISPESLAPAVRKMQEKHQNIEEVEKKNGIRLNYSFESIRKAFPNRKEVKNPIFVLSSIAIIVLFVSIMNYMLLTLSLMANRTKLTAILKCYGAEKRSLQKMIFTENSLIFVLSLAAGFVLILIVKPLAEVQVGHSLEATLNAYVIIPVLFILTGLMLSVGYFSGHIFTRIPVTAVFRNYRRKTLQWKKALLSVQFMGAASILAVLTVVSMQYGKMKNADHGYVVNDVYYGSASGMQAHKIQTVINELKAMPEVKNVGLAFNLPIEGASGNNVYSPDGEKELFNVADFYHIDDSYFPILEIPVISGQAFEEGVTASNSIMISRKGEELLMLNNGWKNGAVGKDIEISEHNANGISNRISGIFSDIIVGTIYDTDIRPSVFFYWPREKFIESFERYPNYPPLILIKMLPGKNTDIVKKITDIFNRAMVRNEAEIRSLAEVQENRYQPQKGLRNAIYAGSSIILLITLVGLLGYMNDEISRNRKNLAVRKINGATVNDIIRIFIRDIAVLLIPCTIIGLTGAWYIASRWLQNFSIKISLEWWIFVLPGLCICIFIGIISILSCRNAARQNPVESLRYE